MDTETNSKRDTTVGDLAAFRPPKPVPLEKPRRRLRIIPFVITLLTIGAAGVLGRAMWHTYMAAPWTRDATVRAYVVTMAPEVSGRIVKLPVVDNQFVHKGDLLLVIDPTDYKIAVALAEAAVQQTQASATNAEKKQSAGWRLRASRLRSSSKRPT